MSEHHVITSSNDAVAAATAVATAARLGSDRLLGRVIRVGVGRGDGRRGYSAGRRGRGEGDRGSPLTLSSCSIQLHAFTVAR